MQYQGSHKAGEKIPEFPGFSRTINLLFHRLSQQKVNLIMTFVKGNNDPVYPVNSGFLRISSEKSLSIPGFPGLWPP